MSSSVDAKSILDTAGYQLNDKGATRWTIPELLKYLNAAQLEIATLVANSNANTVTIALVTGCKQSMPADGIRIVEFIRNMGTDGLTPGAAIRVVDRKVMSAYAPDWSVVSASNPASATVVHGMYNAEDDNQTFYVWPPQPATNRGQIEIIYDQIPTTITNASPGTKITIDDFYANALLDYVLYRGFDKDADSANQAARAQAHYQAFARAIGAKFATDNNSTNEKPAKR